MANSRVLILKEKIQVLDVQKLDSF